jgi:phosphatidylglycerol---prolipoprotein diacylglyceryl transferase
MDEFLIVNKNWGIMPVLFHMGKYEISSYTFFVLLGITVATLIYLHEAKKANQVNEFSFLIAIGAFFGSSVGAKVLEILINLDDTHLKSGLILFLFSGRTVIGGLIGGTLGVWLTKRIIGLKEKRGNLFAPAIAIGMAIGRIGCFFNGCCYGLPSGLPWAVDFGDGITRHPTQLYELVFMASMFFVLKFGFNKNTVPPGYLFKILMVSYFIFRFLVEFIRVEKIAFIGLTYFQIISIFVLIYLFLSDKRLILNQAIEYGKSISRKRLRKG